MSNIIQVTFSRVFTRSFTKLSKAINPKSSTKNSNMTEKLVFDTLLMTLLIYIKKNKFDIRESCRTTVSIFFSLLSCLLMTNCIFCLVKEKPV